MIGSLAVSTRNLVKCYGRRRALDGFTLEVPLPGVLGLVGPNGAGKTTWMKTVAGLVRPTGGSVSLLGTGQPFSESFAGQLAILPQDSDLPLESTPRDFLLGLARLQGLPAAEARASVAELLSALNLEDRASASIRALSHGMRKRLVASQCFLGHPRLILLDEPMNGLDPDEAVRLRELVMSRAKEAAVVVSSHNLSDLEKFCSQIAFVHAGKVTKVVSLEALKAEGATLESAYLNGDWRS